jgi:hypothetical protein
MRNSYTNLVRNQKEGGYMGEFFAGGKIKIILSLHFILKIVSLLKDKSGSCKGPKTDICDYGNELYLTKSLF